MWGKNQLEMSRTIFIDFVKFLSGSFYRSATHTEYVRTGEMVIWNTDGSNEQFILFFRADVCSSTCRNGNENIKEGKKKVKIYPNNDIGEKAIIQHINTRI
jgi:hypothetical protein